MASEETKKEVSGLVDAGVHLLMDEIQIGSVQTAIEWILEANFKNTEKKHKELNLVVCSPGGDLSAAFALIDVMRGSAIPIKTTGLGMIASAGLLIFISGSPGKRILTPNTSILRKNSFAEFKFNAIILFPLFDHKFRVLLLL